MGRAPPEQTDLLRFRQDCDAAILRSLDVNYVWVAADGTIFHILLVSPRRWIDGDDDFLAAGVAGVALLLVHAGDSIVRVRMLHPEYPVPAW